MVKEAMAADLIKKGREFIQELNKKDLQVKVALWMLSSEKNEWQLIIATPRYDTKGPLQVYSQIQSALTEQENLNGLIELEDIIVISPHDILIQHVKKSLPVNQEGELVTSSSGSVGHGSVSGYFYRLF